MDTFDWFVLKFAVKDARECAVLYLRVSSGHRNGAEEAERLILLLYRPDASDCACADERNIAVYISHRGCLRSDYYCKETSIQN